MRGTILSASGLKPIEEIEVGDEVLAYEEETGEQAYKPVTRLFRNTTEEWYHIRVNGEEIVCTGGHPFYVLNAEEDRKFVEFEGVKASGTGTWICARELKVSDQVLLSDGSRVVIEQIEIQNLDSAETTYNFEVADFHTYYVSESNVLVHNDCIFKELGVKDFNDVGRKYTPNELINKLDDLGFSKTVTTQSAKSGPATIMNRGDLIFRIQGSPANGKAYFRVLNNYGNYLNAQGQVVSNVSRQEFRLLTHFYFGG